MQPVAVRDQVHQKIYKPYTQEDRQADQNAVGNAQQGVFWRDKVGEQKPCAGVIMGGKDYLCGLHISDDQIPAPGEATGLHLHFREVLL